jgi:GST-like protein
MWRVLEGEAASPWFLGERFSALDLYVAVMTNWRPGRKWFDANTPRLAAIAARTAATPKVAAVLQRNFG